ncbi:MAG: hypothetical protein H6719_14770 [Sandaracinaceae bacterium]|nr:hypothetical protein [Sandaracinaceae bacterium]
MRSLPFVAALLVLGLSGCRFWLDGDVNPRGTEPQAWDGGAPPPLPPKDPEDAGPGVPPGAADAGGPSSACGDLDYRGRCEGSVVTWCASDGTIRSRDCAEHGLVCGWLDDATGNWCLAGTPPPGTDAGAPPPGTDAGAPPPMLDAGPPPGLDAGTAPPPTVGMPTCQTWPEQQTPSDGSWGSVLTDIVRHLPSSYGSTYYDSDHITYGHETSHGIHSHIRNYLNDTGTRANGFYLPGNRACLVREPMMRKSDVAAYIPSNLHWSRYGTYISGASSWDDTPLYVWDEWNAYINGAEVGVQRASTGLWTSGWRGTVDGVIEFVVYGTAVGMAAEAREPGYFTREPNFLPFLALELERSMTLFRQGQGIAVMQWDEQDQFYERLRTSSEAAPMRDWIRARFGAEWTTRVMGF